MTASIMPVPKQQYDGVAGIPLLGGKIYTYAAGTSTPKQTFTNAAGTIPHTNPIVLNARGEPTNGAIWWDGAYRVEIRDALGNLIYTVDNYVSEPAAAVVASNLASFVLALSSGAGSDLVGFLQAGAGAVPHTMQDKARERVSVFDFMTDAEIADTQLVTPVLDLTASLAKARAYLVANATRCRLCFPAGIYRYSVSPNWGIQNCEICAEGEVRLRYVGVANAVTIDAGGASGDLVYHMAMNNFIVEAPATAQNGLFVRGIHHSELTSWNIRGCGTTFSGMLVRFAVCTDFSNFVCSVNEGGFYLGAKPENGMTLDIRNAGQTVSYCLFNNTIVEGTNIGIQLLGTLGNIFVGGTSEGCTSLGVFNASSGSGNKFFGMDFEANTTADVYCLGAAMELNGCDSTKQINFGGTASRCTLRGGQHSSILVDAGATRCTVVDTQFNRTGFAGTFSDVGTQTYISNVLNIIGGTRFLTGTLAATPGLIANNSIGLLTVTVTGAKFGDQVSFSWDASLQSLIVSAYVTAANTVTIYLHNATGGGVTIPAGNARVVVTRS